jgi:lipid-A-disaccharide synthase
VRGYVEVLRHYREIVGIRDALRDGCCASGRDLFIGVDAPDFNLGLEQACARRHQDGALRLPVDLGLAHEAHRKDPRACDHVLCIFPFEPELLARHGVAATYVGHPLARSFPMEPDRPAARAALGLPPTPRCRLLPGSRAPRSRPGAALPAAAALLQKTGPAPGSCCRPCRPARAIEPNRRADGPGRNLKIVTGQSHTALAACDVTLVASGTATLEAALFKRPMVISYHTHWLTYALMKPRHLQPWVGLPNILCRDFVVPELLQSNAKPDLLSRCAWIGWTALRECGRAGEIPRAACRAAARHADPCRRCHRKSPLEG